MKYNSLVKKLSLSKDDLEEIKSAVGKAESKTSGEIVVALAPESSSYAFWELLASSLTSLLFLLCLLPLSSQINEWLGKMFWGKSDWYLVAFFLFCAVVMILAFYVLYNVPGFDRLVIPVGVRNVNVTRRALRCFMESGVYCTKNHSGILIYISYFENQVRIIADKGISQKISQDLWNLVADELSEGIAKGSVKEAFINAIEKCGDLLAENFPLENNGTSSAENGKENELNNSLIILEDEKWA